MIVEWKKWRRWLAGAPAPERDPETATPPPAEASTPAEASAPASPDVLAESPSREPVSQPRELALEQEVRALRAQLRRLEIEATQERSVRLRLEEDIKALADFDPLTGLAATRRFNDRLAVAIAHAQRSKQQVAIVQLGVDGFAASSETLGPSHADDLLRSVALTLESTLRQADTIARLGATDVFTILLAGIKRDADVMVVADKLQMSLRGPFSVGGREVALTVSIGLALFPDDGPDAESLLQSANTALGRVRARGGDGWDVHAPRSRAQVTRRQARETALRRALARDELELLWRPIVQCDTGAIVGMESLLRARIDAAEPAAFISLAEENVLAVPLGQWALRGACRQGSLWQQAGHRGLLVSVAVSVRQLSHAALIRLVRGVLDEAGLPPECLELEVAEGELAHGPELVVERLAELRRLGTRIALGHFGTGESRLAHLYRYPADTLKIDASVVRGAISSRQDEAVMSAAIALARSRRLAVVADGVESEAHRVLLARWQCDRMLGPLLGSPTGAAEAESLLQRQRLAVLPPGRDERILTAVSEREAAQANGWFLETATEGGSLRRLPIGALPFRIGRRHGLELVLPAESVSKAHAELYWRTGLRLRDLGSKNGTFLNRVLVDDAAVTEGDILHFADFEFRLGHSKAGERDLDEGQSESTAPVKRRELPHRFAEGTHELRELLQEGRVTVVFQPIVLLARGSVAAYEALGRGRHPRLPESPTELFRIAESIGAEAELSRLFRRKTVELLAGRRDVPTIFLNTHPVELARPGLLESLEELRNAAPQLDLALEIHESVLTRPAAIAELRAMLLERNIALAYDDFGAGQARLLELAEAPPHYLKFDRRFVSGLDQAPQAKRLLLQSLLRLASELFVRTVAEGVETPAESQACAEMGFTYAQGFAIGRPRPIDEVDT